MSCLGKSPTRSSIKSKASIGSFMISVRNPLQQLSGNKRFIVFACISGFLLIQSCIPRSQVVKPVSEPVVVAADTVVVRGSEEQTLEEEVFVPKVALLLPFQLNRSAGNRPGDADVKRAELALDFYQGFEMGLKRVAEKGISFQLDVLDTRDDEWEVQRLARTP